LIPQEICVDASVAGRWIIAGESWQRKARVLLRDAKAAGVTLIAPPLFEYEIESVVQGRVYNGRLLTAQADVALTQLTAIGVQTITVPGMVVRAREIARRYDQERIYDALYAALAELRDCEFWTADTRFYDAVRSELSFVRHLLDYPDTP
jgi:predicted nucleic acid-binding protein